MALPSKSSALFYLFNIPYYIYNHELYTKLLALHIRLALIHYLSGSGISTIDCCTGSTIVDEELSIQVCCRNRCLIPSCLTIMRSRSIVSHLDSWPCCRRGRTIIEVAINILPVGSVVIINILRINDLFFIYLGHSRTICSVNIVAVVDKINITCYIFPLPSKKMI